MFLTQVVEKMKTHILYSITFSENRTVYEIIPKNMVQTERPRMMSQYGAYALHAGLAQLHELIRMYTLIRSGINMHALAHINK